MDRQQWIASEFEQRRDALQRLAFGLLGVRSDAEDAVQETWLRLSRSDVQDIDNLGGWLNTVIARVALDMLRARRVRAQLPLTTVGPTSFEAEVEREALLGAAIGSALLVVLDRLRPPERLAFVLHDVFGISFDEIASILGRSRNAAKQLASRARSKVRGNASSEPDLPAQAELVSAFLAASRRDDFEALLWLLDPDVELVADQGATRMGIPARLSGANVVAGLFRGRAQAAQPTLIDGHCGFAWIVEQKPRVVWDVMIENGRIAHINMLASREAISVLELEPLRDTSGCDASATVTKSE